MIVRLTAALAFGISVASAAGVNYVCDQVAANNPDTYAAGTCAYLASTIAPIYNHTFTDANATILVEQGITGLGGSTTADDIISFSSYLTALTAASSHDAVDTSALVSLTSLDTAVYGSDSVIVTNALAGALGFTSTGGVSANLGGCILTNPGCYDGVIVITTPAHLTAEQPGQSLYYRQLGGTQGANQYDFYSIIKHETDEILGTSSCIDTQGATLTDPCDGSVRARAGTGTPSAVDLFRYNSAGSIAANNAYLGLSSAPAGAYFSYNGGVTNGAAGAVYNTLSNGDDYADFTSNCAHVQDANGCLGKGFDITNDGNSEINILDAVGFNLAVPEPGTWILLAAGFAVLFLRRRFGSLTHL